MPRVYLSGATFLAVMVASFALGDEGSAQGTSLRRSVEFLKQPDPRTRALGARALGELGRGAADATEALASKLADDDSDVSVQAATALGRIGAPAVAALPSLITALGSKDEHMRYAAAWAVSEIINDLKEGDIPFSAESFDDQLTRLEAAAETLRKAGSPKPAELVGKAIVVFRDFAPARPSKSTTAAEEPDADPKRIRAANDGLTATNETLLLKLNSKDAFSRIQAADQLGRLGDDGVPAMLEALRIAERRSQEESDYDDFISLWPTVRQALARVGPAAAPALAEALADPVVNYAAGDALQQLGPTAHQATPKLLELLNAEPMDPEAQTLAANVLGAIGPRAVRAVEPLAAIVRDENRPDDVRRAAATALGQIGKPARTTAPQLIQVMENKLDSDSVRAAAAEVLGSIGAPATEIVPALVARLADEDELEFVQAAAIRSLTAFGDDARPAVEQLVKLLDHDDIVLSTVAAQALVELGSPPAEVTAPLLRMLDRDEADEETRQVVAAALTKIGPAAIRSLVERLGSADEETQARTAAVIAHMGPQAAEAVEPLVAILNDQANPVARRFAVIALGELGAASEAAIGDLVAVLTSPDEDPRLRAMVATALGELGTVAAKAVPVLVECIHDPELPGEVRAACVLAAPQVTPEATAEILRALDADDPLVRIAAARALYRADLAKNYALPTLLSALESGRAGYVAAEVLREIGSDGVRHLCDTVRDQALDLHTRRTAVRMLGEHYTLGALREEAARVLIEAMRDEELRDEADTAIVGIGPAAIPLLMAELERQPQRESGDEDLAERIRALVVQLCIPTGEGGDEGWFDDPTGFDKYDQLGVYSLPPTRVRAVEPPWMIEKSALPNVLPMPEMATEPAEESEPVIAEEGSEPDETGYKTVKVFYGTNRQPESAVAAAAVPSLGHLLPAAIAGLVTMLFGIFSFAASKARLHSIVTACGLVITLVLVYNSTGTAVRVQQAAAKPGVKYGNQHSDVVELGTCEVSIPAIHQTGQLEGPSVLRLEWREDPLKHLVLQRVEQYEPDRFFDELRSDLAKHDDSILIFIHGYNVTFEDAARRTAQMAYDLEFQGAPMFYSWPSQGNWYRYREDEKYVELAVTHIKRFLLDVASRSQARSIHLIAHSMGNRALAGALREIQLEASEQDVMFNQVVLAAPDINADIFKQTIAPAITRKAQRVTLYASSNDLALAASRTFNAGGPRAGDASAGPVVIPGIETIDVSDADTSLLGHSYYGSSESVLDDLRLLLLHAASADQRPGLNAVAGDGGKYWIYGNPTTARRTIDTSDLTY